MVRNGQAGNLQHDKCRSCSVTFNALTGTPLNGTPPARLRHRDKRVAQALAMDERLRFRKAAARMGVHRTTTFRWRQRFVALPQEVKASGSVGVVEADETYVLRSCKGQRRKLLAQQLRQPPSRRQGCQTRPVGRASADSCCAPPRRPGTPRTQRP